MKRFLLVSIISIILLNNSINLRSSISRNLNREKLKSTQLQKSENISKTSYKGYIVNDIYTGNRYNVGLYQHYHKYEIKSIQKITGIYSNFFGWYSVKLVKEKGASVFFNEQKTYNETTGMALNFNEKVSSIVEIDLYEAANLNYDSITSSSNINSKLTTAISYINEYYYTRKSLHECTYSCTLSLNSETVNNFSENYAVSIGKAGEYAIIETNVTTYEIYLNWFKYKHKQISGDEDGIKSFLIVNESELITSFILKDLYNSENTYYC